MKEKKGKIQKPGFYVNIDPIVKKNFTEVADKENVSLAKSTESLLKYFLTFSPEKKRNIINGIFNDSAIEYVDLIAHLNGADHHFISGKWHSAIEGYEGILKLIDGNMPSIVNWAKYRMGFCWFEIAYERYFRVIALCKLDKVDLELIDEEYDLAIKALQEAYMYNKDSSNGPPRRVLSQFNIACAISLLCHFKIERRIISSFQGNIGECSLVKFFREEYADDDRKPKSDWEKHAVDYFDALYADDSMDDFVFEINRLAFEAMRILKNIRDLLIEKEHDEIEGSIITIISVLMIDLDLGFLRSSGQLRNNFPKLFEKVEKINDDPLKSWCKRKLSSSKDISELL